MIALKKCDQACWQTGECTNACITYTKPEGKMSGQGNAERDNALWVKRAKEYGFLREDAYDEVKSEWPEETVLQEADRLTAHPRGKTYGHPYVDFTKVTNMAHALWGRGPESPEEHALYMILVKLARLEATPGHHDSIVDIAGYIKTYDMVIQEKVSRLTA